LQKRAIGSIYNLLPKYNELANKNHFQILLTIYPMWGCVSTNYDPLEALVNDYPMPPKIQAVSMLKYLVAPYKINFSVVIE